MEHPTYPSPSDEVFDPGTDVGPSHDSRSRYHRRRSTFGVSRETVVKAKRRMPYLVLLILVLSLVGVVVGLSISLTSNDEDEEVSKITCVSGKLPDRNMKERLIGNNRPLTDTDLVKIRGRIRITNRKFSSKYKDTSSAEYRDFKTEFVGKMDAIYKRSDFKEMYIQTTIIEIKSGSLFVSFEVDLEPMRTEKYKASAYAEHTHNRIYNYMVRQIEKGLGEYIITEFMLSIDALDNAETYHPTTPAPINASNPEDSTATFTYMGSDPTITSSKTLERKESCTPNLCQHNGMCTIDDKSDNDGPPQVRCYCTNGYGGDFCETPMSSRCESSPCQHNGICRGDAMEYTCECTIQYFGDKCEFRFPDPCNSNPCQNGATCYGYADASISIFSCFCPTNYGGKMCELSLDNGDLDSFSDLAQDIDDTSSEAHLTCEEVQTPGCLDIIQQNLTIIPNPFGFGDTGDEVIQAYISFEPLINDVCHLDAHRVLCSLLNPECPDIFSQEIPVISLFEYDLPCRSLCLEVGASCFTGVDDADEDSAVLHLVTFWEEMCDNLPESAVTAICFTSSEKTEEIKGPSSCTPSPCSNGGTCFELSGTTQCRCPYGFGGLMCDTVIPDPCENNPCLNGGTCVSNLHYGMSYHWCKCPETEDSHVFYGINCELPQEDQSLFMPHALTCTDQFLPPECKNIVPYNTTSASAIVPPPWTSIEPWTTCHPQAALFLCSILAPPCTDDLPLMEPCMSFCQTVDPHCSFNFAALGLHKFSCSLLPDSADRNCFRPN